MLCKTISIFIATIFSLISIVASAMTSFCFVEDLLAKTSLIRCGAEELAGMTKKRFVERLTWVKTLLRFNITNVSDRRNFERVSHTLETLRLDDSNGSVRVQPYCLLLTGPPGCGKSNYALQLAVACLKKKYGQASPSDIVVLNETDEFQSEYRTSHRVVIFDDLGAENASPQVPNPWRKVIDFVNNIRKTSLNPNVEMKGNVYIQPDLVIITTNMASNYGVPHYMKAPSAIYRRLKACIELRADFKKASRIVKQVVNERPHDAFDYVTGFVYDRPEVDREELIQEITQEFILHMQEQEAFVNDTNSVFDMVENKSVLSCLYDDLVLPYLPRKIPLPKEMEHLLPMYHKVWRMLCVEDTEQPVCMMASINSLEYSEDEDPLIQMPMHEVFNAQSGVESPDDCHEKLIQFLARRVDWEFYSLIRHALSREDLVVYDGAIVDYHEVYSFRDMHYRNGANFATTISCSRDDLDEAYDLATTPETVPETITMPDEFQARMVHQFTYSRSKVLLQVEDLTSKVSWMNKDLAQTNLGVLHPDDPMSIVQYLFALRARRNGFRCLGVEYPIGGYIPDVVLKYNDIYIIIECKNTNKSVGRKQVEKYMQYLHDDFSKSIGILFTNRGFKLYAHEKIESMLYRSLINFCHAILKELSQRCEAFGTQHFKEIDHCGVVVSEEAPLISDSLEMSLGM